MSSTQIPSEGQEAEVEYAAEEEEVPIVVEQTYIRPKRRHDEDDDEEEEDLCDSAHLLLKNTKSFKCLAQVILSNSSLLRHPLYYFPPLVDPGIDDAFNYVEPEPMYDDVGIEKYLDMCRELEIVPISRVINSLEEDTLNLKFYGLTEKQMKAISETLIINAYVRKVILEDNFFKPDVAEMLSNVIKKNRTITVLNLKECRLGVEGVEKLNDALGSTQTLRELDLSFNEIGNIGLAKLQDGLADTLSLRKLNLSHNNLTEDCGVVLQIILRNNNTLEDLDLSWNQFCTALGNKKIFLALGRNDKLKALNLAWNAIAVRPAMVPLMRYLRKTEKLQYLDLSNNRLAAGALKAARTGILKNRSLREVKIGNNIYTPQEAYSLASILTQKQTDPITVLDMENMYFNKEIYGVLYRVKQMGKVLKIGGVLSNYRIYGPDINKMLFERCRFILQKPKKQKAKKDFGHFILSLPEKSILREEFDELLVKKKMTKLDLDLINQIVERFPARRQKIDVVALTKVYMGMYPDTKLPPPPKKKPKKGKKGQPPPEPEVVPEPAAVEGEGQLTPIEGTEQGEEHKCAVPTEGGEGAAAPSEASAQPAAEGEAVADTAQQEQVVEGQEKPQEGNADAPQTENPEQTEQQPAG